MESGADSAGISPAAVASGTAELEPVQQVLAQAEQLRKAGQLAEADRVCQAALRRYPDNIELLLALGSLAMDQGELGDAEIIFRHAVSLAPESAIPHMMMGTLHARAGKHHDAIAAYRTALELRPGHPACLLDLGFALKTIGRRDEAVAAYREIIRAHPESADAYWALAEIKTVDFEPGEVDAMEKHVGNENLTEDARVKLCFALGKAYDDRGEFSRAFHYYGRGNSMRRMHVRHDTLEYQAMIDRLIEVFDAQRFSQQAPGSASDPVPIFIVGLPRSGSTLIEQILASHSRVEGTRELPDLPHLIGTINNRLSEDLDYPDVLQHLNDDNLFGLGRQYLESTKRYRRGKPCFTDKMPNNFIHVGLIKLILPNARVIDARRHPLDSCLGSFKQLFIKGQPFTYDLDDLGEYYLQYRRLMDHWHEQLPGYVHEVQYEELVETPEAVIRDLLKYCGLPWESGCLRFHETDRAVESASSQQVRQPIYSSSVNSWRHYEYHLGELVEILQPVLDKLPEEQRPASLDALSG
jgi:tetratricopeptide (TPR) repeat protein